MGVCQKQHHYVYMGVNGRTVTAANHCDTLCCSAVKVVSLENSLFIPFHAGN